MVSDILGPAEEKKPRSISRSEPVGFCRFFRSSTLGQLQLSISRSEPVIIEKPTLLPYLSLVDTEPASTPLVNTEPASSSLVGAPPTHQLDTNTLLL